MQTPQEILKQYWGHDAFRPLQEDIINEVLQGNDVLALLPTGGGKSICFQVPALLNDGLCIVISPLIALMKDQVENLQKRGVSAMAVYSGMSYSEVKQALHDAASGKTKFLYVSPERLLTNLFLEFLPVLPLNLIAVDEAHCISQWGYDFRPPYLKIAALRNYFPKVPVLALTASATPVVQADICSKLQFKTTNIFRQSFEKPNLSFSVFKVDSKFNKLLEVLQKVPGTAIVYCRNRRRTKEIAQLLQLNNITAGYYHAGLPQAERSQKQEDWINNKVRIMVCTNAFGMGIDKPDVRVVVHIDVPDNIENYYQEAGRAGRDGKRSYAVLLINDADETALAGLPEKKYPALAEIQQVYQAIANHLQIAVGNGSGLYYDFNLQTFITNFKLDLVLVVNVLKALEQDGHLTFNEQVFIPAKIGFLSNRQHIEQFEMAHQHLEPLIKSLLRTYAGIIDNVVAVNEKLIQRVTRLTADQLSRQLTELQAFGLIDYQPQKETPQLFFVHNRAPASHLNFNTNAYLQRKDAYKKRVEAMLQFLQLAECRSKFLGNYFGDVAMNKCGVCDNCLRKNNPGISTPEFNAIAAQILAMVNGSELELQHLFTHLPGIKRYKVWEVLNYLQAESKLVLNEQGHLQRV